MGNDTSAMPLRPSQSSPTASSFSPCLTELSIATVHKDRAIKHAVFVGSNTIATCGDDPSVHIWDAGSLAQLSTLPDIVCKATIMACVGDKKLVTTHEVDGSTFLWDLSDRSNPVCTRKLIRPIENPDDPTPCAHRIIALDGGWFATAYSNVSDDRFLYVWNDAGELVTRIERQDGCKLNDMLYISISGCPCLVTCHDSSSSSYVLFGVAASSNLYIYKNVYEADAGKRGSPQIVCTQLSMGVVVMLHKVNHNTFASGSADGTIILWENVEGASEPQFKPRDLRRCESQLKSPTDDWRVRQMVNVYNNAYLLVAAGFGFFMFDVQTGAALLQLENVHENFVSHIVVVVDEDLDSGGSVNSSSSSGDKNLDVTSPVKDVAAAAKTSMDKRGDISTILQKTFLVSVSGNSFSVWRLVTANFKKTIQLPAANQVPKVKKPKQQPKFKNAEEPDASNRLEAVFIQCCTCPAPINAVASLSPFCSFVSFHNDGDIYCWRTSDNAINGAAICASSLCSQKSVNDLMALWFETESHFDIPDTNFTLPVTASGFNLPELNRSEDPSRAGVSARADKKTSTSFEYSSAPPGIPPYLFENVVELIKDNEPPEEILGILRAGDHSEEIIACVKAFLECQTQRSSA